MDNYEEKIKREQSWHTQAQFQAKHFLNTRLFYSPKRNLFNYIFPKRQLTRIARDVVKTGGLDHPRVLIVPVGAGDDIQYLPPYAGQICGIDIYQKAIDSIPDGLIEKHVGDMKHMAMFSDNSFDIVVVPLFFHHYVGFGFDDYLLEVYRVLKRGGHFISLEPSSLHPLSFLARGARKVFGNITGLVEDEVPFNPVLLSNAMKRCGYQEVMIYGASYSHNRTPIWLAKLNNVLTYPLLRCPGVKYLAWMCLFYGKK